MIFLAKIALLSIGLISAMALGVAFEWHETKASYPTQLGFLVVAVIFVFIGGFLQ